MKQYWHWTHCIVSGFRSWIPLCRHIWSSSELWFPVEEASGCGSGSGSVFGTLAGGGFDKPGDSKLPEGPLFLTWLWIIFWQMFPASISLFFSLVLGMLWRQLKLWKTSYFRSIPTDSSDDNDHYYFCKAQNILSQCKECRNAFAYITND